MKGPPHERASSATPPKARFDLLHFSFALFMCAAAAATVFGIRRPSGALLTCDDPRAIIIGDVHGMARELRVPLLELERPSGLRLLTAH